MLQSFICDKSEITDILKPSHVFETTYVHTFDFLCFAQQNNLFVICFLNFARFLLVYMSCIHSICFNFSPCFHGPLEPVLFLGYYTAYPSDV